MDFTLILKKINNKLTSKEQKIFDDWYNASKKHRDFFEKVVASNDDKSIDILDVEKAWYKLNQNLKTKNKQQFNWKYALGIAASFLIAISLYLTENESNSSNNTAKSKNTITSKQKVGKEVVLTLKDGNQVVLDDQKEQVLNHSKIANKQLVYENKKVTANEEVVYNYLTVPRGKYFNIKLSDGTSVWLNSDSKIKYPVAFLTGKDRTVELIYGEAYFDVSPSTNHNGSKFNVLTQQQTINVLGTQFNLQAFNDEDIITTTLVEGKIELDYSVKKQLLSPNEQVVFNVKNEKVTLKTVDTDDYIAWIKGEYNFKNKSLFNISKTLSRWYDVDFVFENETIKNTLFTGVLNRKQTLIEIFETINKTQEINYEMKKDIVIIK